jgi:acyl dehydratase
MERADFASLEQLEAAVGQCVARSSWLEVTQQLIDDFARVTGDTQWIHVDPERARRESPFGTTIAHGFLTLSLLARLSAECISLPPARFAVNYGFERIRFVAPVPVGSRVSAEFTLNDVKRAPAAALVQWGAQIVIANAGKPALTAIWLTRIIFR